MTYPVNSLFLERSIPGCVVKAVKTGEFRRPRKGEYYLSGAIPVAYEAPNDFFHKYHIMKLVKVRKVETEVVESYP